MLVGDEMTESNIPDVGAGAAPPSEGRILYERFLVQRDLGGPTFPGFSSYLVKDFRNPRGEVILKTAVPRMHDISHGPFFPEVCRALMRLAHPHIEVILETGVLPDGNAYAVARRYPGIALTDVIGRDNRLELPRVAAIVDQIADALSAAHSIKVLHCDVSPGNVLLTFGENGYESVRLTNFGAAWPVDARGDALENIEPFGESFAYAAPELHSKLGHRSPASDVYSLAVLAYRLITGRLPFEGVGRVSLLKSIAAGQIALPTECRTDLSGETEKILLAGLQFEPAMRPRDVEDFGSRLARSLRTPASDRILSTDNAPLAAAPPVNASSEQFAAVSPAPAEPELRRVFKEPTTGPPVSDRAASWALIILLLAGALSIPLGQTLMAEEGSGPAVDPVAQRPAADIKPRQVRYWFAQPNHDPDKAGHQTGTLFVSTDTTGNVIVFSQFLTAEGRAAYKLVFPASDAGPVEAEKLVNTGAAIAGEGEHLWVVWTPPGSTELEEFRQAADSHGSIPENEGRKLRHLLERNRNSRVTMARDADAGHVILTGTGERIVHRVEFDPPEKLNAAVSR